MEGAALISRMNNGLTVILENLPHVESIAYELSIPGGLLCDREGQEGSSLVLAELLERGAGAYDSKRLSEEFEKCGIQHSESAGHDRFCLRGQCLAGDEVRALELLSLMVFEPKLPLEHIESIKKLLMFDLDALEDAPGERTAILLSKNYFPGRHGRSPYGKRNDIASLKREQLLTLYEEEFKPDGSVFSICGKLKGDEILSEIEKLFGGWKGSAVHIPKCESVQTGFYEHIDENLSQLYLTLAFPSVPCTNPVYYVARVFNEILSGGMFGRLFIELRERQGLCYGIQSRYIAGDDTGNIFVSSSTTPERSAMLLSALKQVLGSAIYDLSEEEIERAKVNLITSVIFEEEVTHSRCSMNSNDWWVFKRVRPISELRNKIRSVEKEDIIRYVEAFPFEPFSMASIGAKRIPL
ncbi:MAG: insulinase family protein [SAR324 cluster bacterium]|uniref:Insulinase family protein n=1 Tax=SAR324 cluster bacterium TaxID=2024889 RepID=A0A7X9FRD3_9DELT|nr:insulinase family protein [SAR324 cluster bacterium]